MPVILHDYLGRGHDLSKGAFDSVSQTKPGSASKLLTKYMPEEFEMSWRELTNDYRTTLKSYEPSYWSKLWKNFGRDGLMKAVKHGATAYSVGRPAIHKWIAGVAISDPAIGGVVAAAEVGLSKLLESWGASAGTTRFSAKKGQWLFIESETHYRRRLARVLKPYKTPHNKKPDPPEKVVSLGFFIEPTAKNRASVFSLDHGRSLEVEISQLIECDTAVAQRLDGDERLSTLRELFFYKYDGATKLSNVQTKPFFAGRRVIYGEVSYILLSCTGGKALLEDANGKTIIVNKSDLTRDMGDSTPGRYDDGFITSGQNAIYTGQWVFVPARPSLRYDYETNIELAVVNRIAANSQTLVFYAWDGKIAYVDDAQLQLISKAFQELYNSKPFNGFRSAAIDGTKKTERLALGKTYPMVCIGRSYEDAMKVGKPFEAEESDYGKQSKQERDRIVYGETTKGPDAGNNDKDAVDLRDELAAKGLVSRVRFEKVSVVRGDSSVNGMVVVTLAIAALAYALYAA